MGRGDGSVRAVLELSFEGWVGMQSDCQYYSLLSVTAVKETAK